MCTYVRMCMQCVNVYAYVYIAEQDLPTRCGVLSDKQHLNFACLDGTRTGKAAVS